MPSAKQNQSSGVSSASLTYEEGYGLVRSWEDQKIPEAMARDGKTLRIDGYSVSESPKAYNVQVTVYAQGYEDQRKAEWATFMLLKMMHPSIYKEQKISFIHEAGFRVVVQWTIWKPRSMFPAES